MEAALWWYHDSFPVSMSTGVDFRGSSTFIFLQGQTGIGMGGISLGPYLELQDGKSKVGVQTDFWLNYFAGLNYRVRYSGRERQRALGVYFKAPFLVGDTDEESKYYFDWDWD